MATWEDAEKRDVYYFFTLNEAIDVTSDRGDYNLRPPTSEDRLKSMRDGRPSIVNIPRMMLEMLP